MGGFAVGLGVTIAAFKDFNKVIPEVKQTLSDLQNTISTNFWDKARQPIKDMVDSLLPAFRKGVADTATQLGGFFGSFAKNLGTSLSPAMGQMFTDLSSSITIATGGTQAFADIIATLGKVGTSYLPQLSQWFVNISKQFADFLKKKGENGIKTEIDEGITALKELGGVLYNTYGILSGVAKAATDAGGTSLASLNDALGALHKTVDSKGFQSGLVDVFNAAHVAMNNIAGRSGPAVKQLFIELGSLMTTVLPQAGEIIGTALSAVAKALAQPAVTDGIKNLFTGLDGAVAALAPAMAPLGQALGSILSLVGTALPVFASLISAAIIPLAGAFAQLAPQLGPIIQLLGGALTQAFNALAPVIQQMVPIVGTMLGAAFQFLAQLLPPIAAIFQQILAAAMPLAKAFMDALAPILPVLADALGQVMSALQPLIATALKIISAVITPLLPMLSEVVQAVLPPLADAISRVVAALQPFLDALLAVVNFLMPILVPIIQFIVELLAGALVAAINGVGLVLEGLKEYFVGLWEYVSGWFQLFVDLFSGNWSKLGDDAMQIWNGIVDMLHGVWDVILGALEIFFNVGILGSAGKALKGLSALFKAGWKAVTDLCTGAFAAIRGYLSLFFTGARGLAADGMKAIGKFFSDGWKSITGYVRLFFTGAKQLVLDGLSSMKKFFVDGWNAIRTTTVTKFNALVSTVSEWIGKAVAKIKELPGKAKSALGSLGSTLLGAGRALIRGFIDGVKDMFSSVKSTLGDLTDKLTDWKGPLPKDKVLLYNAGVVIIKGLIKGLESQYDNVKKSLTGLTDLIGKAKLSRSVTAKVKADQKQLNTLLASYDKIKAKLDAAKKSLADLKSAKADYAARIAQKIVDDANVTNMEGGFTGIIEQLKQSVAQAKIFGTVLAKLKAMGLNSTTFDQLAQAGPEAGMAAAEAILSAGKAGVDSVNDLEKQLDAAATKVGNTASQVMYDNGIHMAEGLVKGLESQASKIEDQMLKIADSMVKAIKKALGIHSPSRVLAKIGAYVGQGFRKGLLSEQAGIASAVEDSLMIGQTTNSTARNIASAVGSALGSGPSTGGSSKTLNYYAAPGSSLGSEEDLFAAANRARMGW
jgi:phage-related protein